MAEILETISNTRVKVEYDDPYSGSPFFSGNSLSAKIEKSPTLILHQEGNQSPKKDTLESGSVSMASSLQELQETTSSLTSDTRSEELTAIDNSYSNEQVIPEEFEEVCYENVSSNLPTSKNKELSPSQESSGEGEVLSDSFCELDSAIYDAPWDLGALQKGLEEKFKLNEQSSQDDLQAFDTSQKPPPLSVGAPRTSLPPVLSFHGKNSPELADKFPKHGSNTRQPAKGRSPSRKTDPNPTFDPCDPRQVLQKRPLPAFPTPQSTPTSSFKSNNFPSGSLVSVNDRQHFQHPLQRRGVPVMGGGSVGRGHQLKPLATQASDWRPLEDYDSPWDNRQKDLMSTFSQGWIRFSILLKAIFKQKFNLVGYYLI